MPVERSRLVIVLLAGLLLGATPAAPRVASAQPAEDESPAGIDPCHGKARLRGPVFARNSVQVEPGVLAVLDLVAGKIKRDCAAKTIVIEAHTDVFGDPAYNKHLSEARAREIKRLLVERGVDVHQLETVGYGAERPLARGPSRAEQALNRRIAFVAKEPPRR
jgi:outer membrane protein OmpA-like peptidoglycan-associated protein